MTGANAPAGRRRAVVANTGSSWILCSGFNSTSGALANRDIWDESMISWRIRTMGTGAPGLKELLVAVWSGIKLIVWGGRSNGDNWGCWVRSSPAGDTTR